MNHPHLPRWLVPCFSIFLVFHTTKSVFSQETFTDISGHFAQSCIDTLAERGLVSGFPQRQFRSQQNMPRMQALVAICSTWFAASGNHRQYAGYQPPQQLFAETFRDSNTIPSYATNPQRLFPNQSTTRADIASSVDSRIEFLCQAPVKQLPKDPELRGVWLTNIDSDVLFSRDQLTQGIQRLQQLNINTLYPAIYNSGYTLYPSQVAQKTIGAAIHPQPGLQGRDMLQEIIQQAHNHQMDVIPWVEFGFMAPADSLLAEKHPEWLTHRQDGSQIWMEGKQKRVWLNPFHPEVQQFILDLVVELAKNYDIDGIQFDDHLGLPVEMGYDRYTVQRYQQEHNGKKPPDNPHDPEWVRWRANKLTAFVERLFAALKTHNTDAVFSAAVHPYNFAYSQYLQDWVTWERKGFIEELIVQVYRDEKTKFVRELKSAELQAAKQHIPVGVGILTGLKNRGNPIDQIQNQVEIARRLGFAGVSFFFYESMFRWSEQSPRERISAFQELFPQFVQRPEVTSWQNNNSDS